jgi:hypothetical protein
MLHRVLIVLLGIAAIASAEITGLRIIERSPVLDGEKFGKVGAYERVVARASFEADPATPARSSTASGRILPAPRVGVFCIDSRSQLGRTLSTPSSEYSNLLFRRHPAWFRDRAAENIRDIRVPAQCERQAGSAAPARLRRLSARRRRTAGGRISTLALGSLCKC